MNGPRAMTGLDVHRGLRIRLAYNAETKGIDALANAENDAMIVADVQHYIATRARQLGYAEAWLAARSTRP